MDVAHFYLATLVERSVYLPLLHPIHPTVVVLFFSTLGYSGCKPLFPPRICMLPSTSLYNCYIERPELSRDIQKATLFSPVTGPLKSLKGLFCLFFPVPQMKSQASHLEDTPVPFSHKRGLGSMLEC